MDHESAGRVPQATEELGDGCILVIQTKWVDVNKGDAKRPEYRSTIVREGTQTLGPDRARNVCVDGTVLVRDVLALQSADVESLEQVVRRLGRSCSWMLPGHTVKQARPVRWLSYRQKSK